MIIRTLLIGTLALGTVASAANALTVMNYDSVPHTLKITPKTGKAIDVMVKAKANADIDCKAGCQVTLDGKSQVFDAKAKTFMIKGSIIVLK